MARLMAFSYALLVICLSAGIITAAEVPSLLNYQGRLTTPAGLPVADETYSVNFTIYDDSLAGSPQWAETLQVATSAGLFNVQLGSIHPVQAAVFASADRWIGIGISTDPEITPRTRFTSVAYAFSGPAFGEPWTESGENVYRETGNVGIGTTNPDQKVGISGMIGIYPVQWVLPTTRGLFLYHGPDSSANIYAYNYAGPIVEGDHLGFAGKTLRFATYATGDPLDRLCIDNGGNVGIGTTVPYEKVDIHTSNRDFGVRWIVDEGIDAGAYCLINSNNGRGRLALGGPIDEGTLLHTTGGWQWNKQLNIMGNVGIGTTSPQTTLDVNGNARATGSFEIRGHPSEPYYAIITSQYSYQNPFSITLAHGDPGETHLLGYGILDGNLAYGTYLGSHGANKAVTIANFTGYVGIGTTNPSAKLHVVGSLCVTGEKNALVPTSQGMTKVYSEESAEVWFTDYGKARLVSGKCYVELDPLFLETVTIDDENSMMVFLQEENECNGLIAKPGQSGFDVIERANGKSDAAFSYRIVAKRRGYEEARLDLSGVTSTGGTMHE